MTLPLVEKIFSQFSESRIFFCHFKSNNRLKEALEGEGDLDLLFHKKDRAAVESVLRECGIIRFVRSCQDSPADIEHYYGFDANTGTFVHFHLYYHLVTGGALLKNHHLACERELINRSNSNELVPTPWLQDEYSLLIARKMVESASLLESIFLWREYDHFLAELIWLEQKLKQTSSSENETIPLLKEIPESLFRDASLAFKSKKSWLKRRELGKMFCYFLKPYQIRSSFVASVSRVLILLKKIFKKIQKTNKLVMPQSGLLVAILGPDLSGKSTLTQELGKKFSKHFQAKVIHSGKPPASCLTFFPRLFRRFLRLFYLNERAVDAANRKMPAIIKKTSLIFAIRCCVIAYDRMRVVKKARNKVQKGCLVFSDRYPGRILGSPDGPEINSMRPQNKVVQMLGSLEEWLYHRVSKPDVVLNLTVSLGVARQRNESRSKVDKETDEYLKKLYVADKQESIDGSISHTINTGDKLDETLLQACSCVWKELEKT